MDYVTLSLSKPKNLSTSPQLRLKLKNSCHPPSVLKALLVAVSMRFRTRLYNLSQSAWWRDQERSRVFVHKTFTVLIFTKEMKEKEWFQCLCLHGHKLSLGSCSTDEGDRINAFIHKEKAFTGLPRFLGPGARIHCLHWVFGRSGASGIHCLHWVLGERWSRRKREGHQLLHLLQ